MASNKPGVCAQCGKATRSKDSKRCRTCWGSRGNDGRVLPPSLCRICGTQRARNSGKGLCRKCYDTDRLQAQGVLAVKAQGEAEGIRKLLKSGPKTLEELGRLLGRTEGQTLDALRELQRHGVNLHEFGGRWSLESIQPTGGVSDRVLTSDRQGWHVIGCISDTHLCSVHERLDVLRDAYRRFEAAGVTRVLHSGNWIDGEARFNKFELKVHGMDGQLRYLGEQYPQHKSLETWSVAGDDHEGWYAQREGVNIGAYAEDVLRRGGRADWVNLGYMEAFIPLVHGKTGAKAMYHLMHPGGGSAYATSYTVQKIVEGYEGGEKPAVLQAGHYHKTEWINVRNVWVLQPGCTQDQTVFARKKKITFSLAATILQLWQNPETGAIEQAICNMKHYFNRGYYVNDRWSLSGPINQVPRLELR